MPAQHALDMQHDALSAWSSMYSPYKHNCYALAALLSCRQVLCMIWSESPMSNFRLAAAAPVPAAAGCANSVEPPCGLPCSWPCSPSV